MFRDPNYDFYSDDLKNLLKSTLEPIEQFAGVADIKNIYPPELMNALRKSKVLLATIEKEMGGLGLNFLSFSLFLFEVGKRLPALSLSLFTHEQVLSYLRRVNKKAYDVVARDVVKQNSFLSLAITEPGAGTDVKKIDTKLIRRNGRLFIRGTKSVVTNGAYAKWFLVLCKYGDNDYAVCLLNREDGVSIDAVIDLPGMRGSGISRITFREIEIEDENVLERGKTVFSNLFYTLSIGRILTASVALGVFYSALEEILKWGTTREVLDRKLIEFDNVVQVIGEFVSEAEICRNYLIKLAIDISNMDERELAYSSSIIKYKSTSLAKKSVDFAMTLYGSHGYLKGTRVERMYRDIKAFEFIEGSNEALKAYVFKSVLKRFQNNLNLLSSIGGNY